MEGTKRTCTACKGKGTRNIQSFVNGGHYKELCPICKGTGVENLCKVCGEGVSKDSVDQLCDSCWEVVHRLEAFLRTEEGKRIVFKTMLKIIGED